MRRALGWCVAVLRAEAGIARDPETGGWFRWKEASDAEIDEIDDLGGTYLGGEETVPP